jgi:hypothetical protein
MLHTSFVCRSLLLGHISCPDGGGCYSMTRAIVCIQNGDPTAPLGTVLKWVQSPSVEGCEPVRGLQSGMLMRKGLCHAS